MLPSADCLTIIKEFEGYRSKPYRCSAGIATTGYGTTIYRTGKQVCLSDPPITEAEASEELRCHLTGAAKRLSSIIAVELSQCQFDALLSLTYNIGVYRFRNSTMRRHLNQERFDKMPKHFASFRRAGGRILPGLVRRRCAEIRLFAGLEVSFEDDEALHYESL